MTATAQPVPGNFYSFNFEIEVKIRSIVEVGYRVECYRISGSDKVRWGTLTLREPGVVRVTWIDDEQNGLGSRTIERPEDLLGAEGRIGDLRLQFEHILELSRNFVVYALYSPNKKIRLAYGFERRIFRAAHAEELN